MNRTNATRPAVGSRVQAVFTLVSRQRWEAALAAGEELVARFPTSPDAWNVLGLAAAGSGELSVAAQLYGKALALEPAFIEAENNLGIVLAGLGRVEEGIAAFHRALRRRPDYLAALDNLLLASHCSSVMPAADVAALHRAWGRLVERQVAPLAIREGARGDRDRIHVGYVSADFKRHSVAWFLEPVLARHDRDRFHVTAYASVPAPDAVTARLRGHADIWRDVAGMGDGKLARLIATDGIDVLVDLSGHTLGHRLVALAHRPARVQVTWLGYPATTGLSRVDHRITDEVADPEGMTEAFHTEKLVRLPEGFLCYGAPAGVPAIVPPPSVARGHVTFGCFNDLAKVGEPVLAAWARLLDEVPGSRLLLKARGLGDAAGRARLVAAFTTRGIAAERIECVGFRSTLNEHLAAYEQVDVALDTFPYNGTTTTCEALWMGVPVVTIAGASHAARVGASLLAGLGLAQLVANDPADYVARAVALAGDAARLAELRGGMRARLASSPLLDAVSFTRQLEAAYVEMLAAADARR